MLTDRPSRSLNVYICFSTTSVTSPTAAHEERRVLEDRRAHLAVGERVQHLARLLLDELPLRHLGRRGCRSCLLRWAGRRPLRRRFYHACTCGVSVRPTAGPAAPPGCRAPRRRRRASRPSRVIFTLVVGRVEVRVRADLDRRGTRRPPRRARRRWAPRPRASRRRARGWARRGTARARSRTCGGRSSGRRAGPRCCARRRPARSPPGAARPYSRRAPSGMSAMRRSRSCRRAPKLARSRRLQLGVARDRSCRRPRATAGSVTSSCVGPTPPDVKTRSYRCRQRAHRRGDVGGVVGDDLDRAPAPRPARAARASGSARSRPRPCPTGARCR